MQRLLLVALVSVVGAGCRPPPGQQTMPAGAVQGDGAQANPSLPVPEPDGPAVTADTVPPLRIANWNILHLGQHKKDYALVAKVVENFDLVALEEVMTTDGVDLLLQQLPGWKAVTSSQAVGENGYFEYYSVLYREARVTALESRIVDDANDEWVREPFMACFKADNFDFCTLSIHVTFGTTVGPRDAETAALARVVTEARDAAAEKDFIILGDFNRPDTAPGFTTLRNAGWDCKVEPQATATSIGGAGYASPYDHILVNAGSTTEWTGDAARFDMVAAVCGGDFGLCKKKVSDHAPVFGTISVGGPDDD